MKVANLAKDSNLAGRQGSLWNTHLTRAMNSARGRARRSGGDVTISWNNQERNQVIWPYQAQEMRCKWVEKDKSADETAEELWESIIVVKLLLRSGETWRAYTDESTNISIHYMLRAVSYIIYMHSIFKAVSGYNCMYPCIFAFEP